MSSSPTDGHGDASVAAGAAPGSDVVDVTMPQMGVSVAEGTLVAWRKQPGDWVELEETVCEISTDKIDIEVPAPAAGRLAEILVEVEQTVPVGTALARIDRSALAGEPHPDEQIAPQADAVTSRPAGADHAETAERTGERAENAGERVEGAGEKAERAGTRAERAGESSSSQHYSPVVQRIARSEGVDLEQVTGSGRGGRVRKQDVLAFIASRPNGAASASAPERPAPVQPAPAESPAPESTPTEPPAPATPSEPPAPLHIESPYREDAPPPAAAGGERLSRMRRSIAEHMVRSLRTAAHCTSIVEADFSAVEAAREQSGMTYLPFVARCVIDSLRTHPELNATLEGELLTRQSAVNLGIAISLAADGLIVPVIHDAHELSHEGLARRISELADRARAGRLTPDEVRGGTFTITNPGGFGTLASTPIINQPQVAILDLEAVVRRPVVVTDDAGREAIAIRPMAYLCLSWDHRALDGAIAAQFLSTLRGRIESWRAA